jgi:hypothetical protein
LALEEPAGTNTSISQKKISKALYGKEYIS